MNQLTVRRGREVRQLLRQQQRKKRNLTSCYPCRTRKVKCDHERPCGNCTKRGYPELCSTTAPETGGFHNTEVPVDASAGEASPNDIAASHAPECPRIPQPESSPVEQDALPRVNLSDTAWGNETVRSTYVGANSTLSFIGGSTTPNDQGKTPAGGVEDALLPMLGMKDNCSSYPFLSTGEFDPERALPFNHEIIRLFECYRTHVHFHTPLICDIDHFEKQLCAYLASCKEQGRGRAQSVPWFGLLLAVLGSGAQFADTEPKRCLQKSQEYIRVSFHCLKLANFLVRPSILCIQTLLLIGKVLQNNLQPETAWILLGTTTRMAQSLGLHISGHELRLPLAPPLPVSNRLWLAIVWQDTLLSLCFDRPPTTPSFNIEVSDHCEVSHTEAMYLLCNKVQLAMSVGLREGDLASLLSSVIGIENIAPRTAKHLQSVSNCSTIVQHCQFFIFNLNISFVIAWLCRPTMRLSNHSVGQDVQLKAQLRSKCKTNLIQCVQAYIQLHSISIVASRSWAIIHNGLSSALLLGLLDTSKTDSQIRNLLSGILHLLSTEESPSDDENPETDARLSKPHARAIAALRNMYFGRGDAAEPAARPGPGSDNPCATTALHQPVANLASALGPGNISGDKSMPMPQEPFMACESPLEMFDSILWEDPVDINYSTSDFTGLPDPWTFANIL